MEVLDEFLPSFFPSFPLSFPTRLVATRGRSYKGSKELAGTFPFSFIVAAFHGSDK